MQTLSTIMWWFVIICHLIILRLNLKLIADDLNRGRWNSNKWYYSTLGGIFVNIFFISFAFESIIYSFDSKRFPAIIKPEPVVTSKE